MHLYLVHVLHALLTGEGGFYQQYYFVRHILPPYSLYYYTLMLLSSFLPVLVADKLIICCYFVSFAFGLRYLAKAVGPSGELMAIPATLLLLNWPLAMGFVNFCLSMSFAFWALGLWCRAIENGDTWRRIGFVLLAYVIMLTHPLPLLTVLGFCGIELCVRLVRFRRSGSASRDSDLPPGWVRDALYVLAASGTLVYVKLFTFANVLKQVDGSSTDYWKTQVENFRHYVFLITLSPFSGRSLVDIAHRGFLYFVLCLCLFIAVRSLFQSLRTGVWTLGDTWTLICLGLLLSFPFIPPNLNNSSYFSARMVIFLWISALIAASGARVEQALSRIGIVWLSVAATVLCLCMAYQRINPIARDVARLEQVPEIKPHSVGLFLHTANYQISTAVSFDPYFWNGARMFRRTDSVLYNTPWLELQIIPLGPRSAMPNGRMTARALNESNFAVRHELETSYEERNFVLSHVDSAIVSGGTGPASDVPDALLREDPVAWHHWGCEADGNFSICALQPVR